ncbi:MAG TPA: hypothetical protein IGS40_27235 [Trichormus sp. M33_DOE_039]|nr:hypothetical protein [Trichormus sp. M33_DOE_039]
MRLIQLQPLIIIKLRRAGHLQATSNLVALDALGCSFEQDHTTVLSWYHRVTEAGDLEAMFMMGTMYTNG